MVRLKVTKFYLTEPFGNYLAIYRKCDADKIIILHNIFLERQNLDA